MRDDLQPGSRFPDVDLPDQDGDLVKLSSLMRGYPTVVVFSRGYY
jgi:peroxiredoxin